MYIGALAVLQWVLSRLNLNLFSSCTLHTVDQRLGLVLLAFFLFSHFRSEKEKERFRARNVAALPPGAKNPYEQDFDYGGTGAEL
jgi:hypothetical protein